MTAPEITAALRKLIADTPPPVTVWGVRYPEPVEGAYLNGDPYAFPAGHIVWGDSEAEARAWLAEEHAADCPAELVRITGSVHPADTTATVGGAR